MTEVAAPCYKLAALIALVVGNALGAGVYTTSGFLLADLGSRWVVLAVWFVGGIIALLGSVSYGMLARQLAGSGGEYLFLSKSLHPAAGIVAGWISLVAGFAGAIAYSAITFEVYARSAFPISENLPNGAVAVFLIITACTVGGIGIRAGGTVNNIAVASMLLALGGIGVVAAIQFGSGEWKPTLSDGLPNISSSLAIVQGLVWVSFSYSGFNAAIYVAGEAERAERDVPLAMIYGTILLILLYVSLNALFLFSTSPGNLVGQPDIAAIAAEAIGGRPLRRAVEVTICLSLLTSITAMAIAAAKVCSVMARDHALPRFITAPLHSAPSAAAAIVAVIGVSVTLLSDLQELLSYLGLVLSLSLALTVSTLFVRHFRNVDRPQSVGYPIIPALFIIATVTLAGLVGYREPSQLLGAIITISVGVIIYLYLPFIRQH